LLAPLRTGKEAQRAFDLVRSVVPTLEADRPLAPNIEAVAALVRDEAFPALLG